MAHGRLIKGPLQPSTKSSLNPPHALSVTTFGEMPMKERVKEAPATGLQSL